MCIKRFNPDQYLRYLKISEAEISGVFRVINCLKIKYADLNKISSEKSWEEVQ